MRRLLPLWLFAVACSACSPDVRYDDEGVAPTGPGTWTQASGSLDRINALDFPEDDWGVVAGRGTGPGQIAVYDKGALNIVHTVTAEPRGVHCSTTRECWVLSSVVIEHSVDGGELWDPNPETVGGAEWFALGGFESELVLLGGHTGGASVIARWTQDGLVVVEQGSADRISALACSSANFCVAATAPGPGLLVSNDAGATWVPVTQSPGPDYVAVDFLDESTGWVLQAPNSATQPGRVLTTQSGPSALDWPGTPLDQRPQALSALTSKAAYLGTETGVIFTLDGGLSWQSAGDLCTDARAVKGLPSGVAFAGCADGRVFRRAP